MPSKRDPSKQRRAAQNRAARAALANRKVNASAPRPEPAASGGDRAEPTRSTSRTRATATRSANDLPGRRAALLAALLAVGAAISLLFLKVPVDEHGNALTKQEQKDRDAAGDKKLTDSFLDVYGPAGILLGALPTAAAGVGLYSVRAGRNARWITGALIAMVLTSAVGGAGYLFFPSLAALAVAYYQVRKAERIAQLADRPDEPDTPAPESEPHEESVEDGDQL
jgi:hypothetical protein